jgi:glycosyltransferase involved in cell wall biosynthesis
MKISLLSFDLSHNCLGRAYLLAKVLEREYEVEIIGPTFGDGIWNPVDTGEFQYSYVRGLSYPTFFISIREMLKLITGDVIYAIKPRPTSYGIALLKKIHKNAPPLVLDIDDWEVGFYIDKNKLKLTFNSVIDIREPNSFFYTWVTEKLTKFADDITVSSSFLQNKFGGIIVPHGRDTNAFDPTKFDRESLRSKWDLDDKKVIMFLGSPSPHKGLEEIAYAVKSLDRNDVVFMMVGAHDDNYVRQLQAFGGDKIKIVGMQPFHKVPVFLAMADLVVLPQRKSASAVGQVPAKVFDAMAMAKPVIATNVSDLPEILDGCGWIVEPESPEQLAETIQYVLCNPGEAEETGRKARQKCIEKYSWAAMERILTGVFDKYD